MPKVTFIAESGTSYEINLDVGTSVMQGALHQSIPGIEGECGGALACATCRVRVPPEWQGRLAIADKEETEMLSFCDDLPPETRLSCQLRMTATLDGLVLNIPVSQH